MVITNYWRRVYERLCPFDYSFVGLW
jgi:hypothetical protein